MQPEIQGWILAVSAILVQLPEVKKVNLDAIESAIDLDPQLDEEVKKNAKQVAASLVENARRLN